MMWNYILAQIASMARRSFLRCRLVLSVMVVAMGIVSGPLYAEDLRQKQPSLILDSIVGMVGYPGAMAYDARLDAILAVTEKDDSIHIVSPIDMADKRQVVVGRSPTNVIVLKVDGRAYTWNSASLDVSVVDLGRAQVVATVDLAGYVRLDESRRASLVDAGDRLLLVGGLYPRTGVSNSYVPSLISIDPTTLKVDAMAPVTFDTLSSADHIVFHAWREQVDGLVFVARSSNPGEDGMVISVDQQRVSSRWTGVRARCAHPDSSSALLWLASEESLVGIRYARQGQPSLSGEVRERVLPTAPGSGFSDPPPCHVDEDGTRGYVYWALGGTRRLVVQEAGSGIPLLTQPLGAAPTGVTVTADGGVAVSFGELGEVRLYRWR